MSDVEISDKGFVPAILLCFFFGVLGVHRFYVGKIGTGILQLIMIVVGAFKDKQGFPVKAAA